MIRIQNGNMITVAFEGKPSGDGECFCFEVSEDEYIGFLGKERHAEEVAYREEANKETGGEMYSSKSPWRIYPHMLFGGKNLRITITTEEITE